MEHRTIEIDFDVHKLIETDRKTFAESDNAVLRRLLGLAGAPTHATPTATAGRAWASQGVTLPSGTQLQMNYNSRVLTGYIEDGVWIVEGKQFSSPSSAASELCRTKMGRKTSIDGWKYGQAKRPGDSKWTEISTLRSEAAS
jgi:hypothetical protein